ncbi:class I SAM-dependent methyltransferase [candidate division KSB1 bacterium]|nr:class I SAM-dependent methyltransferase [candidate division KSB1 bacterium]
MKNYQAETYGEHIVGVYDEWYGEYDPAMIEALAALAPGGRALELGIGTGRIALPLQAKGITVHGIDASPAMLAKLQARPGSEKIPVVVGNFAEVAIEGQFDLVYVVFNTFYGLLTQEEQLRCFQNVKRHLQPNGVFVIEAFVPDLTRFTRQQNLKAVAIDETEVGLDVSRHDPVTQQVTAQHVRLTIAGIQLYPVKLRYVWPAEFDLMARLAGMQRRARWGDWRQGAFTADSQKHISIFEHAG